MNFSKNNNPKSQELTKASLLESQKAGNKYLQMRCLYVYGRIMVDTDSIIHSQRYYDKALILSEEIEDHWYTGEILFRKGINQYSLNKKKRAFDTFNKALYFCQLSDNFKTTGSTYSRIGIIFRINGAYSKAIESFIKAKLSFSKIGFGEGDAWVSYLLGRIHSDLKNSEKAMQYFQESLDKYQVISSIDGNSNGITLCYEQIAHLNMEFGNFDEASKNIDMILKTHTEAKSKYGISLSYSILGKLNYLTGNYKQAIVHLKKSLKIKKGVLSLYGKSDVYKYLGLCLIETGYLNEGIERIKQALEIAISTNSKKNQLEIYSKLAVIYSSINNLEKVIYYKNKLIEVQDLIIFGESDIKIEQLQVFYEIDKKNQQVNELRKEKEVNLLEIEHQLVLQNLIALVLLVVFVIAVTIYLFYNKLRHKNRELKILNTTKNTLFSIIAHDLRSPFNTILGFSDLLTNNAKNYDTSKIVQFSSRINSSAVNTLELLDNLLNWAKSQTGQISYHPVKLNLQPIIVEILEVLKPTAEFKNVVVNYMQYEGIEVYADLHMLKTILRNIITNAIKFTNSNGCITVNATQRYNFIEISVSDDGVGMNNETRKNLFTLQNSGTTLGTANEKGSGLGLVLCKDLVEKHGGTIWATSELKKGSTFYVTFPNAKL
ncbi:MAG: tetratricopeptide repeat-containing sensor histidine kinase [Flavobacteriaceae bacterium]|nr:tetratricopeptide repeat-containing sensor histidine kinase [Flavobacteriaceae bacterium]